MVVGTATVVTVALTTGGATAAPVAAASGEAIQAASQSKSPQDIAEEANALKETLAEAPCKRASTRRTFPRQKLLGLLDRPSPIQKRKRPPLLRTKQSMPSFPPRLLSTS